MISLAREFNFDSAHCLHWHNGKCSNLHGHTYKLQVFITGKLNENGIIIDLNDFDSIVKKEAVDLLDHNDLNNILENPTVENLIIWIWNKLETKLEGLHKIQLWETPKSFAVYTKE